MYRYASVFVAASLLCISCATTKPKDLRVRVEYPKTVNWSEMNGFRLASAPSATSHTRYKKLEGTVSKILIEELTARGYERIENGSTDFRVAFDLVFRGDKRPSEGASPYGSEPTPGSVKGAGQVSHLTVKMLDPGSSQILWQGTVTGFAVDLISPEPELRKAVWRLLAEFPPITG
jgi:hypothetical protein